MKWMTLILTLCSLTACAWLEPDLIPAREVVVTSPPNKFLEPFFCGKESIDVTTTVKQCRGCKPAKKEKTKK